MHRAPHVATATWGVEHLRLQPLPSVVLGLASSRATFIHMGFNATGYGTAAALLDVEALQGFLSEISFTATGLNRGCAHHCDAAMASSEAGRGRGPRPGPRRARAPKPAGHREQLLCVSWSRRPATTRPRPGHGHRLVAVVRRLCWSSGPWALADGL